MPNWVYSGISISTPLTKKQEKILKKIEKAKSICDYYEPRPQEMDGTRSPVSIITEKEFAKQEKENKKKIKEHKGEGHLWLEKGITKKMSDNLIKKFGSNNWYDWSNINWGTKWGDCDLEIDDAQLKFSTAWSCIGDNILEKFMKDFPSFHYWYEEEQGWGGEVDVEGGKIIDEMEYDIPEWEEVEDVDTKDNQCYTITKLLNEHPNYDDGIGYYADYSHDFLGKTLQEAKESLDIDETICSTADKKQVV